MKIIILLLVSLSLNAAEPQTVIYLDVSGSISWNNSKEMQQRAVNRLISELSQERYERGHLFVIKPMGDYTRRNTDSSAIEIYQMPSKIFPRAILSTMMMRIFENTLLNQQETAILAALSSLPKIQRRFETVSIFVLTDALESSKEFGSAEKYIDQPFPVTAGSLADINVVFVGVGSNTRSKISSYNLTKIMKAWETYFSTAGATFAYTGNW